MGVKFNPLIFSGLDLTGGGGAGASYWMNPVATEAALPATGTVDGEVRVALDTHKIYVWDLAASQWDDTGITLVAVGSTPNANGAILGTLDVGNIRRTTLTLQPADGSNPGVVTAGVQTFGGNKTFSGTISASNLSGTNSGDVTLSAVGSSPNANAATLSGQVLNLEPADGSNPGVVTTATQTFAGTKTFSSLVNTDGGIDLSAPGTLTIGATNSTVINLGNAGATVNIQGTTIYENTPVLQVTDPLITVNHGGAVGSGQNSGIEIEENSIITGYAETSADRNSWILKAPNTAGIATITPGSGGITLDQSSHDPVTLGTANGLSLAGQQLSLGLSSTSTTGALSDTDWDTFNDKQPAGNYITALTGDATATGPGSAAITFATVNSNVGSFTRSSITVNAKGLVTAASSGGPISLTADVTGTLPIGNGGTNSATALNNNRVMQSSAGAIVEAAAITADRALISDANGIPTHSVTTATELSYVNGVTSSIQTQLNNKLAKQSGDIDHTSFTFADNQVTPADVTGFLFSNAAVRSFDSLVSVARGTTFQSFKFLSTQLSASWDLSQETSGDLCGVTFTITSAGQVQYTSTSTGSGGTIKFRAIVTSV